MMIREIANRRSIRKYKPDEISTEAINKMIQSGRLKNYKWRKRKNGCRRDCLTE